MSSRITNFEPLPGYRLIERLGRGGYGEVWKAEAPGGLHKAIKFVYGDLEDSGSSSDGAEQELKALNRVKAIRHPYILSIERFDIVDGQLLIVMELADRNLWNRFQDCRDQNLPGIPRGELMSYLEETAEALDLMNLQHQIQHLDIKPHNLFLVHNHVKVADFGLAKEFEGRRGTMTGGVTPVYAAPETFEGWVSRYSDQYSLAIVFQEMLTGVRPFSGTSSRHLLLQHVSGDPEVQALPEADRPIVLRALAKKPDDRFPTCMDFIRALRHGSIPTTDTATLVKTLPNQERDDPAKTQPRKPGTSQFNRPTPVPASLLDDSRPTVLGPLPSPSSHGLPALRTPQHSFPTPIPAKTPGITLTQQRPTAYNTVHLSKFGVAPPERTGTGVLMPALVIGLGGTGLTVLQRFRQCIHDRLVPEGKLPHIRTLYIDTDPESIAEAASGSSYRSISHNEIIAARMQRPGHYLKREGMPPLESWLNPELLYRIPRTPSTIGLRCLGRLALIDHYAEISSRIRSELESFFQEDALEEANRMTRLGFRTNRPRIYLISSLSGGTGGGMLIDLAYLVRREMRQLGYVRPEVTGVLLAPPVDRGTPKTLGIANTLACLTELEHYSHSQTRYEARFDAKSNPIVDAEKPLHRATLLSLPKTREARSLEQVGDFAAGIIFQELLTPMGRVADEARHTYLQARPREGMSLQTFGMYRLSWPRPQIVQLAVYRLTRRIIDDWLRTDGYSVQEKVSKWVGDQWSRRELDPSSIQPMVENFAQSVLGQPLETIVEEKLRSLVPPHADRSFRIEADLACRTFDDLLKLLGRPGTDEDKYPGTLPVEMEKRCSTLARELEDRLSGMPAHFIETPQLRLLGAEECVKILSVRTLQILDGLEREWRESEANGLDLFKRILPLIGVLGGSKWQGNRKSLGSEVVELMRAFSRERVRGLILRSTLGVYRMLNNHIPELLREVNHCRGQVKELKQRLTQALRTEITPTAAYDHAILPMGCQNLRDAVEQFIDSFTSEELCFFEEEFQGQLARQCKGFLQVTLRLQEYFPRFLELFERQAREFLDQRLQEATPAEIFFEHRGDLQAAAREIHKAFDESAPELTDPRRTSDAQLFILAAPFDATGDRFRQITRDVLSDVDLVAAASDKDLIFYREERQVPVHRLPQAGIFALEALQSVLRQEQVAVHSRMDVDWLPLPRDSSL